MPNPFLLRYSRQGLASFMYYLFIVFECETLTPYPCMYYVTENSTCICTYPCYPPVRSWILTPYFLPCGSIHPSIHAYRGRIDIVDWSYEKELSGGFFLSSHPKERDKAYRESRTQVSSLIVQSIRNARTGKCIHGIGDREQRRDEQDGW